MNKKIISLLIASAALISISCSKENAGMKMINDGVSVECKYDIKLSWGISSVISIKESPALDELGSYAAEQLHKAQKDMFEGSESKTITITATSDNIENAMAIADRMATEEYEKMKSEAMEKRDKVYNSVLSKRDSLKEEIEKYDSKYYLKLYDFSYFIQRRPSSVFTDIMDMETVEIKTTDGKYLEAVGGTLY